ncbi:unnamed protein product [Arctogadus glacialis]
MEFREKLLKVDQVLNSDDTKALAFLCKDILKCDISSVKSPIDLFKRLEEKDVLSEDQPNLLADLLRVIEHFQLLRELDLNSTMSTTSTLEVFLEMEHMDLLSSSNLLRLEQILKDVRPVLWKQIQQLKDSQDSNITTRKTTLRSDASLLELWF